MGRRIITVAAALSLSLGLLGAGAMAANTCKKGCATAKKDCLTAAKNEYKSCKSGGGDKATCKTAFKSAKTACVDAFKAAIPTCKADKTTVACSPSGAFLGY
jgi:hypothetical protein